MPSRLPSPVLATLTAASLLSSGCRPRDNANGAAVQATNVDTSWLIAAGNCWPDLRTSSRSLLDVRQFLADPQNFRATFATYAALNDSSLARVAGSPMAQAPAPDASVLNTAQTPILTRSEAVHGSAATASAAFAAKTAMPADALCAIQHGTPVGFR